MAMAPERGRGMKAEEDREAARRPIIIVGCPRSGTCLTSRIIGGSDQHFLITEHSNKQKHCPEDGSGVIDSELWWTSFEYPLWDHRRRRPLVETPVYDERRIPEIRRFYLGLSKSRRLVLKNPTHLARIRFLKEMFPSAYFVYCVRNPWYTLQSMIIKRNSSFLLRTSRNHGLPDDLLLKAAFSWGEANEIYLRERDDDWVAVKHEDLVHRSKETIRSLFDALDIHDERHIEKATSLPRATERNYYHIRRLFEKSRYRSEITASLEPGCELFSYSLSFDGMKADRSEYRSEEVRRHVKRVGNFGRKVANRLRSV
jgi:hypothetical protein